MFSSRKPLRRAALLLLVGWVSATGVGVANACLIGGGLVRAHQLHGHEDAPGAHATVPSNAPAEDAHGAPGSGACAKFCADEAGGALCTKKLVDLDGKFALGTPLGPTMPMVEDLPRDRLRVPQASATRLKPSIPVAYLRLTL